MTQKSHLKEAGNCSELQKMEQTLGVGDLEVILHDDSNFV